MTCIFLSSHLDTSSSEPAAPQRVQTSSSEPAASQRVQTVCQTCATKLTYRDAGTQWEDISLVDHGYSSPKTKTATKATQCDGSTETDMASTMIVNDKASLLFTGIHMVHFFLIVQVLEPCRKKAFKLPIVDQILMTFMKLRLNSVIGDIAQRFKVSQSMASKIISFWIDCMAEKLKGLVCRLPKLVIINSMPQQCEKKYPQTTCIIDCAETSLQKPTNLDSRGSTFSHYKSTNTIKYLVAVAMCIFILNPRLT